MLFNLSHAALAPAIMSVAVEGRGFGRGRPGGFEDRFKHGAGKVGEHLPDAASIPGDIAPFLSNPGKHAMHNCCVNDNG